jgi:hypothetical protein
MTLRAFVRVVTINRSAAASPSAWQQSALAVFDDHRLAAGHAVIPSELRRQLLLDVTGSVWVKGSRVTFREPGAIILYPISIVVSIQLLC